jgi:Mn-containing catalase
MASVKLKSSEKQAVKAMAERTSSDVASDPITGADLGAGPGAGSTSAKPGR